MYLSLLIIIVSSACFYLWGYNKGRLAGRDEMQDQLLADPDLYAQLKYADEQLKEPLEEH